MKKTVSLLLTVILVTMSVVTGSVITASATGANQKTTLTDLAGQGGLSYTSTSLMTLDNTNGINSSAMSATPRTDRWDRKQGRGSLSVTASAAADQFVLFQTNVGAFNFTVTDPYAQNIKMWVYVSDCDAIACDHDAVYDTPQEDSFTFYITFGNSTSSYNYRVQHTMHGSGWQEIDVNFATDNVSHNTRKNINWNFKYMSIWCKTVSGVTVKFDDIRLIEYTSTYEIPECENNGRWVSTCDYNALDGGIITEWYGSSFDLDEKAQGTSSLRIDGYPIHVDYRITLSGMSTKAYYDTDVFCMDMYIDDIRNMSTVFEARIGENESSTDKAYYGFSYGLMNAYANKGEGLKSGWNKLEMPLRNMALRINEDYFGEGYKDITIYKITFYNPATAYTGADAPYTFRFDNMYVTDRSNLDLSFADKVQTVYRDIEPAENLDKIKPTSKWTAVTGDSYDNASAIKTDNGGLVNFDFIGTELTVNTLGVGKRFISIDNGEEEEISKTYQITDLDDKGHTVRLRAEGEVALDSIGILGQLIDCESCDICNDRISNISLIDADKQKSVSDMVCTLSDVSDRFSIINTSEYGAPEDCPDTAYFYDTQVGEARKSGVGFKTPVIADVAGYEENWTVDTWVYISDITSYQILLQLIPYGGFSHESMYDQSYFSSVTENWAYRYRLFNAATEDDPSVYSLSQCWKHLQIPLSNFSFGYGENNHTKVAYESLFDTLTISGITIHENNAANYGNYDFAIAGLSLINNSEHTCYAEVESEYDFELNEIEDYLGIMKVSNAWVKRCNKNFSDKYALHTTQGGKVQFALNGTAFSIVSYKSPSQGKIYVSIDDGDEILAADLYADKADTYFKETVYKSGKLSEGKHVITLRTEGKAVIDAFGIEGYIDICQTPIKDEVTIEVEDILDADYIGDYEKTYAWKLSGHNAVSFKTGGSVSFDFEGDHLSVISYRSSTQGKMYVSVDGGAETEIDLYTSSTDPEYNVTVFKTELTYATHTVTIRAEGRVSVDAIKIRRNSAETVTVEAENGDIALTGSWSTQYAWKLSAHNAAYTSTGGGASFSYTGYDFKILSYKARTQGKMYVSIDGAEPIEINLYDDSTDTKYKEAVLSAAGMDYGVHTVEITTSGKVILDAVKIDGVLN